MAKAKFKDVVVHQILHTRVCLALNRIHCGFCGFYDDLKKGFLKNIRHRKTNEDGCRRMWVVWMRVFAGFGVVFIFKIA